MVGENFLYYFFFFFFFVCKGGDKDGAAKQGAAVCLVGAAIRIEKQLIFF